MLRAIHWFGCNIAKGVPMTQELILIHEADGVLELRFNRPEKKNAITGAMYDALTTALAEACARPAVRAVPNVHTDDRCAFAAKQLDRRLADARCRSGDDRDLACQSCHAALIAN